MKIYEKLVIVLIVLGILFTSTYLLTITGRLVSTGELDKTDFIGEILSAEYKPNQPKVLESLTITSIIKNNGKEKNNYLLDIIVMKNGQMKFNDEFVFSLLPEKTLSLSPTYSPDEVGEYQIVLRLYNVEKSKFYDEKILTVLVESDVGPFDLEVEVLSHIVGVGDHVPVIVKVTNIGIYGTDIGLNMELICTNGKKISNGMYIFVNGSSDVEKQFLIRTCGDVGQYSLITSLTLYGKELISSKTNFYVNETLSKIFMLTKNLIEAKQEEETSLSIELINPNNFDLTSIRPFIYNIPSDWLSIKPSSVSVLKPNESTVFVITINVPRSAEAKNYDIIIGMGGNNMFHEKEAVLSVVGAAGLLVPNFSLYNMLSNYWIPVVLIIVVCTLVYLIFRNRKRNWRKEKGIALKKVRDSVNF